jgi:tetratricopeptide (TPR) repeat protein
MYILRLAGIYVYSRERVRAVANQLGLDPSDETWARGLRVLQEREYIQPLPDFQVSLFRKWIVRWQRQLRRMTPLGLVDLEPTRIWYLDRVVGETAQQAGTSVEEFDNVWEALRYRNDGEGLALLGEATFGVSGEQAIRSYTAALDASLAIGNEPRTSAIHIGLGLAHMVQAGQLSGRQHQEELLLARDNYIEAAKVRSSDLRAEAHQGLGSAWIALANYAHLERQNDAEMNAIVQARIALTVATTEYTEGRSPLEWAAVQYTLANALKREARLTVAQETSSQQSTASAARLLHDADVAYLTASRVYSRTTTPTDWAKIQADRAESLIFYATVRRATDGVERNGANHDPQVTNHLGSLEEAIEMLQAAIQIFRQFGMEDDWARTGRTLVDALEIQADIASTSAVQSRLYDQAIAMQSSLVLAMPPHQDPFVWVGMCAQLAALYLDKADLARRGDGLLAPDQDAREFAEAAKRYLLGAREMYRSWYQDSYSEPLAADRLEEQRRTIRELLRRVTEFGVAV